MGTVTKSMSRRSFMKAAGMGAAASALAETSIALADEAAPAEGVAWDQETDVVVVGSGAAGVAAAITAIEQGASVIMVEKWETLGGITSACVQYCAWDSSLHLPQPYDDVTDSADEMFADYMETCDNTADPKLLRKVCDSSPDVIDWMIDHGCEFKDALRPSDGRHGQGKYIAATPGEIVSKIMPTIKEQAEVITECPLSEIVRDQESGRVTGVVCTRDGSDWRIKANKGVIICTGPWPDDEVLGPRSLPVVPEVPQQITDTMMSMGMPYGPYTGEAVRAAMKVGAATRHMEYIMPDPYYAPADLMKQGVAAFGVSRSIDMVLVGPDGKRFTDEGQKRGTIGLDIMALDGSVCYPVCDCHVVPSQLQMGGTQEAMDQWAADGFAARGETLEELASSMEATFGIPAAEALATLNAYNEYCAAGEDAEFGKDPHFLTPLDQPPFYAGPATSARYLYTHGGLAIDVEARVSDVDGAPIPGLYAAGRCTGGTFGAETISGTWQVDCVVFGRIAGANAAADGE